MSKTMKKLVSVCLTIVLVFGVSACSPKKESNDDKKVSAEQEEKKEVKEPDKKQEEQPEEPIAEAKPYEKGSVEGNHFESAWLNMQADFPEEYIMATEEEIQTFQAAGAGIITDDSQDQLEEQMSSGAIVYEMMVLAATGNPNCSLAVEKLPLENMTEKQYLQATQQNLLAAITDELKIAMKGARPVVEIAGEQFTSLEATMNMNGVRLNSNTYVRIKDGYAIVINLTFSKETEEQKEELLAIFKPME